MYKNRIIFLLKTKCMNFLIQLLLLYARPVFVTNILIFKFKIELEYNLAYAVNVTSLWRLYFSIVNTLNFLCFTFKHFKIKIEIFVMKALIQRVTTAKVTGSTNKLWFNSVNIVLLIFFPQNFQHSKWWACE